MSEFPWSGYDRWQNPPDCLEINIVKIPDIGDSCDFCDFGHAVCQIGLEDKSGHFQGYENYCARCAARKHDVDVERSRFDPEEDNV